MSVDNAQDQFLQPPTNKEHAPLYREPSSYNPLHTFKLPRGDERHYQQQYGDMYFLRLARLKPAVEEIAKEAWEGFSIAGEKARRVERVLDVRQGELCWVAGTVYMDMPLKPNILDDLARDHFTAAPPPRHTYIDPSNPGLTQIMLEDESGRVRLTGNLLRSTHLVTGAVIAALGTENANGDFEVIDIKVPDFPRQPRRWERDDHADPDSKQKRIQGHGNGKGKKIAFVSGLGITGTSSDTLALELLTDYLLGYTGTSGGDRDDSPPCPSKISRLIIAGNSLGETVTAKAAAADDDSGTAKKKAPKKYGYDASAYNPSPITQLDSFLSEILPSIPVTLMPGENDPANVSLPQQEIHRAMFPRARAYCSGARPGDDNAEPGWFDNVTNPWEGDVEGWRFWGSSGQNVDDVLRYLDFSDEDGNVTGDAGDADARLRVMEAMLRWRCAVPTAPDTLWCYPFQTNDPFVLQSCPHVFFAGNQPQFKTAVIESDSTFRLNGTDTEMTDAAAEDSLGPRVRLLLIPKFHETGELVLMDAETLEVEVVKFGAFAGKEERQ
ncbi:putative DNA polymerase delta subunit 2 [Thermoascus aurantiacus ATCC 26904]